MNTKHITKRLPPILYDSDPVLTGLRIRDAIVQAVYGTPRREPWTREPLLCSRCLKRQTEPKERPN